MYTPPFNAVTDDAAVRGMVARYRSAWLITAHADRVPAATLLPIMWRGDTVIAHMAKANAHWSTITDGMPGLLIASGPQAYISRPGTRRRPNTARWCRRGTTAPCT